MTTLCNEGKFIRQITPNNVYYIQFLHNYYCYVNWLMIEFIETLQ